MITRLRFMFRRIVAVVLIVTDANAAETGRAAKGTATVINGFVVAVTVTDGGRGYVVPPEVTFLGGGGSGALALATITNDAVSRVIVQTAGNGYTNAPEVLISWPSVVVQPPLAAELVAYYPFDGSADDESGHQHAATVTDCTLTSDRFGRSRSAYWFHQDPVTNRNPNIRIETHSDFDTSSFAFSAWIKPLADAQHVGYMIANRANTSNPKSGYSWNFGWGMPTQTDTGGLNAAVLTTGCSAPDSPDLYSSGNTAPAGRWSHCLLTFDGSFVKIFVNGILTSQVAESGSLSCGGLPILIGLWWDGDLRRFYGAIDDVRIYRRGLTDVEVKSLYSYESQLGTNVPRRAIATATVINGFVVDFSVLDAGWGYTNAPTVQIIGAGTGASAIASVLDGQIQSISVVTPGSGYIGSTTVRIDPPQAMPWLNIDVRAVRVTLHVWSGKRYILESSTDLKTWRGLELLLAETDTLLRDFDLEEVGQYFRVREQVE